MAARKTKAAGAPRKRRGVKLKPTELSASDLASATLPPEHAGLAKAVEADGGAVLATYREPLGGNVLLLTSLPIEKVGPTVYQRDVSDAHVRKLTHAMDKTKRFLDPIIAVRGDDGTYQTPNGNHRLTALKELGAKAVIALLVPERTVAYQILALNIEKAYNLREKAFEVVRLYRELVRLGDEKEEFYALEFEEPALATLGFAYQKRPRISGGAYFPVLHRIDRWFPQRLSDAIEGREARAQLVIDFDDAVNEAIARLKAKGLTSPYLRAFVVARVNPLRFMKGEPPTVESLLPSMTKRTRSFNADKIQPSDLAKSGGAPEAE